MNLLAKKMVAVETVMLDVTPLPNVVDDGVYGNSSVFDAWSWCRSDLLEWRRPHAILARGAPIGGDNPPGMVFVMREAARAPAALPRELARLHAFGYGLGDESALAPWAIDDATDLLYEHRVRPGDVFWLAADSLAALVWGLHDWVHFHNHGPFEEPAMTELQCDLVALAWLRTNAGRIGLDTSELDGVARSLAALSRRRFLEEQSSPPIPAESFDALFLGPYPTRSLR